MQLLCDEGVDRQIVERLRADGHVVSYVAGLSPGKKADFTASAFAGRADEMTSAFSVVSPGGVRTRSKP